MKKQMIALVASMAIASMAAAAEQDAYVGVAADVATTGAALATPGIGEANPLGWMTVPIRLAIIEHAKTLPREEGQPMMDAVSASGWGAAANNLLVLAGASAAAPIVGIAIGYAVWKKGESEREFWHMCAAHKAMESNPAMKCEYRAWKPEEVVRMAQEVQAQRLAAANARAVKVAGDATTKPVLAAVASSL